MLPSWLRYMHFLKGYIPSCIPKHNTELLGTLLVLLPSVVDHAARKIVQLVDHLSAVILSSPRLVLREEVDQLNVMFEHTDPEAHYVIQPTPRSSRT